MKRTYLNPFGRTSGWGRSAFSGIAIAAACGISLLAAEPPAPEVSVLKRASWQEPLPAQHEPPALPIDATFQPPSAFGDMSMSADPGAAIPLGTAAPDQEITWGFQSERAAPPPAEEGWLRPLQRGHPDDVGRHVGRGFPLMGTSWLNRPFHGGWLVGTLVGDAVIDGNVEQETGLFGGYRAGWDFDHYWGTEGRIAFAHLELTDLAEGIYERTGRNYYIDGHLLYYPWGDARLRPYFSLGMGVADFEFLDNEGAVVDETLFHLPLGLGCKYLWKNWLALRLSLEDNFAIGGGAVDSMHNWSFSGGAEVRLGRRPRRYFAYD